MTLAELKQKIGEYPPDAAFVVVDGGKVWSLTPEFTRDDLRTLASSHTELLEAARNRVTLSDRIQSSGPPPHTDFWHQSIDEAQEALRTAVNNVRSIHCDHEWQAYNKGSQYARTVCLKCAAVKESE